MLYLKPKKLEACLLKQIFSGSLKLSCLLQVDQSPSIQQDLTYAQYQQQMVSLAKKIALTAQDMVSKAGTSPAELPVLSETVTADYDQLAVHTAGAVRVVSSVDVSISRVIFPVRDSDGRLRSACGTYCRGGQGCVVCGRKYF